MQIDLPRGMFYSYSLAPRVTLDVAVVQGGPVEHRSMSGAVTGGIAPGATETYDAPGTLVAPDGAAVVELTYTNLDVPEVHEGPTEVFPPNGNGEATDDE